MTSRSLISRDGGTARKSNGRASAGNSSLENERPSTGCMAISVEIPRLNTVASA